MRNIPYWPTEDAPPMMNAGLPENLVVPPSSHGAVKSAVMLFGSWLYSAVTIVASPRGMDAASSSVMLSGTYVITLDELAVREGFCE